MRALVLVPALAFPALMAFSFACSTPPDGQTASAQPASVPAPGNDCAVIAAVAKEHYHFDAAHPAPPLRGLGDSGWRPQCNWQQFGLTFTDYNDVPQSADPRERMKWVEFKQPTYDGQGAVIETGIMHGPLAGMGYRCTLRSGVAGWTVQECKSTWVS